ncbi:g1040 [Coccomyxa elongata]
MALSGAGGSANASFVNDIALSSNSVSLYVMIKKDYEAEYVDNVEQFWGETTRGVEPSEIDEKAFQKAYGDSFICGSLRSVVMMGKMKFEYSQHSDKETVEAAVDAAVSAWGGTMEASTRVKDHLEQAEKNSKTTFELYQTGMKDACDVPTTLTQMLDLMKGFTRSINYDAAAHYQAIIMPYSALHGYGRFKDGSWKEKVAELDAAVRKVLEQYLDSSAAAVIVPRLSTLAIYREEMPVRAGVQSDASGSHENPGWTQLPGNILLQFGSVSATNKNIKEATEGQPMIYLQSLAGDNEVEVEFSRSKPFKRVISVTCTLSDVGQKINRPTTAVGAYSVTTEGFKAAVKATGPYEDVKVYWTAMGYC